MTSESRNIFEELEGFYAWDQGATDSGVKNDVRRTEVAAIVDATPEETIRLDLAVFVRSAYLSGEALEQGYGPEDARAFLNWFYDGNYR
jgi:hypothetical protein